MDFGNNILDAIKIMAQHQVKTAKFDKTIEAKVISCIDENLGQYRLDYCGAIIYAHSTNLDILYQKGNDVYVLVPENDMTKNKIILGLASAGALTKDSMPINTSLDVSVVEQQQNLKFRHKGKREEDQVKLF